MVKPKLAVALITALATISMVTPSAVSASTGTFKKVDTIQRYLKIYDVSLNGTEQMGMLKNSSFDPVYEIKKNYNNVHIKQSGQQKSSVSAIDGKKDSSKVISAQPAKPTQPVQRAQPVQRTQPVQRAQPKVVNRPTTAQPTKVANSSEAAAKEIIASRESGGSYTARSGRYYGRYQLDLSYLNGDLSVANQERTADKYVQNRYTTWTNALAHSDAYGWY